jgi:predicted Ser/Thr protein kinase
MSEQEPSPDEATAYRPTEETPALAADVHCAPQLTPGAVLGGRYRMVSLVGRGGMGEVYRADDLKLGQTVALKFLSHHHQRQRLYEEVRIGRQISHPNVCRLYDVAEMDGHLFITMEFVDGEDLASLLRRVGRLSSEKALAVARDVCAGVAAAHEKGVIHRDLKPANVMIDGRGRGRVTDFGLAVAAEHSSDVSGTPAYMAPEQLGGGSATMRSDIYSLGLVLYEIFTGRRAFEESSLPELQQRQRAGDFTRPTAVTREVPAVVERVIVRCLDADPRSRPASVEEILLELPGGDPLAAAIAAGETPTPQMVAAAARSGELSPLVAWLLMATVIAGIVAGAAIGARTLLYRNSEVKAPEVLQERARQVLADAGLPGRPGDSDLSLTTELGEIVALYRQSQWALRPINLAARVTRNDPPLQPGMASVMLDGAGRLLRFTIVPPRLEKLEVNAVPDWNPFIVAANYDPRLLAPTTPEWSADVDSDRKSAWLTKDGHRIEAASYHGRPVSFAVIPKDGGAAATRSATSLADHLAFIMVIIFTVTIPVAAVRLAQANLRKRQGDRTGASRLALFYLALELVSLLFSAHHPMNLVDEWIIASWQIPQAIFWALIVAVMYIALEPLVRRRWPEMLISWTRLISGRFTDPMIGRDVLAGAATAAISNLVWHATLVVSQNASHGPVSALGPPQHVVHLLAFSMADALVRGIALVVLFVVLRAIIPSDVAAGLCTALLIAVLKLGDTAGPFWLRASYAAIAAFAAVLLARHLGLLAVVSYSFFQIIQQSLPLTIDVEAWYFARSALSMLLLFALAAYAFRISIGSKRWLPRMSID